MNLGDIIFRIKRDLKIYSAVRWVELELVTVANDMVDELANIITVKDPDYYKTSATYSLVADQSGYTLPEDFIMERKFERIDLDPPRELYFLPFNEKNAFKSATYPVYWSWGEMSSSARRTQFYLIPTPDTAKTDWLKLWYNRKPQPMTLPTDIPEIPINGHKLIVDKAVEFVLHSQNKETAYLSLRIERQLQALIESIHYRRTEDSRRIHVTTTYDE